MTAPLLEYQLVDQFINNWLVAGPQTIPLKDLERPVDEKYKEEISQKFYKQEVDYNDTPVDWGEFELDGKKYKWHYVRCLDDHFVDVSTTYGTWGLIRAWAYTQVFSAIPQQVTFVLTTVGAADVWLNGKHIYRQGHFHTPDYHSDQFQVMLEEGNNAIQVRFEEISSGDCPLVMALRLTDFAESDGDKKIKVRVPTCAERPSRHQMFERAFEKAYLEEVVDYRGAHFNLRWADDLDVRCRYAYSVQDVEEKIYVDGSWETDSKEPLDIGHTFRLFERPFWVVLRPTGQEYYGQNLRYQRKLPLHVLDNAYSDTPYIAQRDREALEDATKHGTNLYAEIAKMALGKWSDVNPKLVLETIERVNARENGSDVFLLGLLAMAYRYMKDASFPEQLRQLLEACILNYKYWVDEPGMDGMDFNSESHQILFHACEILAGQLYPEHVFPNAGQSGQWHRSKGEQLAQDWMRKRGKGGFQEWNSQDGYEYNLAALSHLYSLADDITVKELAAVLMDKLFFSLAVNSYKGVFGCTHGVSYSAMLKSGQLEATSGISRLMWGMGTFNHHIIGTVSLACSGYEFPVFIGDIAVDKSAEILSKEHHVSDAEKWAENRPGVFEVNTVTYKTPDYMLSSAQDYRPGEKGNHEHIWQATMSSEAVVFVNHPGCMSENKAHWAGFWHGNQLLPRVAQWKDVLIAVHRLPEDDWCGFTHAFFPTFAFDEHKISGNWDFARKGNGYLALGASRGLKLVKNAPDGYRELRSYGGPDNIWICHMGRAETDGSFEEFQEKIMAMKVDWQGLAVRFTTLRGDELSFGWEGALQVNGKEQPITGFKHYENPYCVVDLPASRMEIHFGDFAMRLNYD